MPTHCICFNHLVRRFSSKLFGPVDSHKRNKKCNSSPPDRQYIYPDSSSDSYIS